MADNIDYEELSDKTISEIKDTVEDRDEVDYERLLEAEKDNKDRKTMKEWLQNRIEDDADESGDEEEADEEFGCPKCDKTFAYKDALQGHVEEAHSGDGEDEESERYECTKCSKEFASEAALERHKDTHSTDEAAGPAGSTGGSTPVWRRASTMFLVGLAIGLGVAGLVSMNAGGAAGPASLSAQDAENMVQSYLQSQMDTSPQIPASANLTLQSTNTSAYKDVLIVNAQLETAQGNQPVSVYVTKQSGLAFLSQPVDLRAETGSATQ